MSEPAAQGDIGHERVVDKWAAVRRRWYQDVSVAHFVGRKRGRGAC